MRISKRIKTALVAVVAGLIPVTGIAVLAASPASATAGNLSFVGSASGTGTTTNHQVTIPAAVQPGDALVLLMSTNNTTTTIPANIGTGWTQIDTVAGTGFRGAAWRKTATSTDDGSVVAVTTSGTTKSVITVAAYRSSLGTASVTATEISAVNTSNTSFTTPTVAVAEANSWLVNYWAEKSSNALTWNLPANVTSRGTSTGTGGGKMSAVLGDSNGAVPTSPATAGRTATTAPATTKAALFSVVVSPGDDSVVPPNTAPTASFTVSCVTLTCAFDASVSSDPENNSLTYAWNFGDGQPNGAGVNTTHTYASPAARTVTLTVTDTGGLTNQTTRSATTTAPTGGPGHTAIVPEIVSTNMPRITAGEIWDLEYIGNRVFVAGGFTTFRNNATGNTTSYTQRYLMSFNLTTGLVDANFRPTLDGGVEDVEASPDGTKLFIAGSFNTVNGVTKRKFASINPTTGAPVAGFTANGNSLGTELEATNSTVYLGGKFTKINSADHRGLAAVDANTGALVGRTTANPIGTWRNDISGGIGPNGALNVQELLLTPDQTSLIVIHTGRQIAGADRYGVGMINTTTGVLRPWRTRLWEDNLGYVGNIQRAYGGAVSPDGTYFVVTSGSGGDRPPINDTAMAFPVAGNDFVTTKWISRMFDSVYSVAISEVGVYVGGHFSWQAASTAADASPGLDTVGYGTGQGLSGYGLGDEVVRRDHIGVLDPATGKSLEWSPGSNSFEGNKAMLVTPRGVVAGGDAGIQGDASVGRIAVYDFASKPVSGANETTITNPIEGRVKTTAVEFTIDGTATSTGGTGATSGVDRVQVEIIDRDSGQYLQDDGITFGASNSIDATLANPDAVNTNWSLPVTIGQNRVLRVLARTFGNNGTNDASKAGKKFETFSIDDEAPRASISGPSGIIPSTTFVITGSATDDNGVRSLSYSIKDVQDRFLQDNGQMGTAFNAFSIEPDVVDATSTTWSTEVTVPNEGIWRMTLTPRDTAGQSSLDEAVRDFIVSSTGLAPTVSIATPAVHAPPAAAPATFTVAPGAPMTFTGTATDDENLANVEIQIRNSTTREALATDGTWSNTVSAGWFRVTAENVNATTLNWSYTTLFNLTPGAYTFSVRATDDLTLTTSNSSQGRLTFNAQVPGDTPPDTTITPTGTITGGQSLTLNLTGAASDTAVGGINPGVKSVRVAIRDVDTNRYLREDGSQSGLYSDIPAILASPNQPTTNWTLPITLPNSGDWSITAYSFDLADQQDLSTTGATSRYPIYPGDVAPVFDTDLRVPVDGQAFTDGRIPFTGRVVDDHAIASVQVAVRNSLGQYMSSTGTFTSTTESWRTAFLNSPGSPGSNYSYTTPVIPAGTYTTRIRGVDNHGFTTNPTIDSVVTVTQPPNNPPVPVFTVSCTNNICAFDGRASTDENTPALTYTWNYGNGSGTGAFVSRTYTSANIYTVSLTVRDEYGVSVTSPTQTVTIVEPPGNTAPVVTFPQPVCSGLICTMNNFVTDNAGDSTSNRLWNFGDGGATSTSTSSALSKTYAAAGTYVVTFTVTDGWGKFTTVSRTVNVAPLP